MSLLSNPRHSVTVFPLVEGPRDADGDVTIVELPPVEWGCSVQPVTAEQQSVLGLVNVTVYRMIGVGWPGGARSRIEWDGSSWDQLGDVKRHRMSSRTGHDSVLMKETATSWQKST